MTTEDRNAHAREQAKLQYEGICEMLARYEHARECHADLEYEPDDEDDDRCDATDDDIRAGLGYGSTEEVTPEMRRTYHDEDNALETIMEDPLSIELRSGWHSQGEPGEDEEFSILLCTGGPAVRIRGELGEHNQADHAWLEFQDWFTQWEEYIPARSETLCEYANHFLGF